MTEPLPETDIGSIAMGAIESGAFGQLVKPVDVVAIGPGIGRNRETVEFVHQAVHQTKVPLVLDADGLNAFQNQTDLLDGRRRPLVLTPHPGEMSRLTGISIKAVQADRAERRPQVCARASPRSGAERRPHHHRAAGRLRLGQSHRQSGHGDRRHRRHPDRHDGRHYRADATR